MKHHRLNLALASLALTAASFAASAADQVFTNGSAVSINDLATANPYPATINVAGLSGNVNNARVTLNGLSHTWPGDLQIILVGPTGQKITLMHRIGSTTSTNVGCGQDFNGATLTFSAGGATTLGNCTYAASGGTFSPTVGANTEFPMPAPAPAGPYGSDLTTLDGSGSSLNGIWSLYISDPEELDSGQIANGWSLTFAQTQSCASEGYTSTKLDWCKNICERGYTGATLDMWIHRWINRYRDLPYCAAGDTPPPPPPPPPQD